jgi:competence protein CoiA
MLLALNDKNELISPIKTGERAIDPFSKTEVISKVGTLNIPHWALKSNVEYDNWYEPMTEWHYNWQLKMKSLGAKLEVILKNDNTGEKHIADCMFDNGIIVEVQHSNIKLEEISIREDFYGINLVWILDGDKFFKLEEDEDYSDFGLFVKIKSKSISQIKRSIYIDFDYYTDRLYKIISNGVKYSKYNTYELKIVSNILDDINEINNYFYKETNIDIINFILIKLPYLNIDKWILNEYLNHNYIYCYYDDFVGKIYVIHGINENWKTDNIYRLTFKFVFGHFNIENYNNLDINITKSKKMDLFYTDYYYNNCFNDINNINTITHLNLSNNIDKLDILNLKNLIYLNLQDNKNLNIKSLFFILNKFNKNIIISTNQYITNINNDLVVILPQLQLIDENINYLINLIVLDLYNNKIYDICNNIWKCDNLQTLNLSHNNIEFFNIDICNSKLKHLNLSNNALKLISSNIKYLSSLEYLELRYTDLETLPTEINTLNNLSIIDLRYNKQLNINSILNIFQNYNKLIKITNYEQKIEIIDNVLTIIIDSIKNIDIEICNIKNLSILKLHYIKLYTIPIELFNLHNLKILNLNHSDISISVLKYIEQKIKTKIEYCNDDTDIIDNDKLKIIITNKNHYNLINNILPVNHKKTIDFFKF